MAFLFWMNILVFHLNQSDQGIISHSIRESFQKIFLEFRERFSLLWRGSRDGFEAKEFHCRCDGHVNTLTVILDTKGNIFGGLTPVKWESHRCWKMDDSLKSFVFTLKNLHNIPGKRFVLKAEMKQKAIFCYSGFGPVFGLDCNGYSDIYVYNGCNTDTASGAFLGRAYTNDTGLNGEIVFTGSQKFQAREIEVFEITA
jgi:hypothetical protein